MLRRRRQPQGSPSLRDRNTAARRVPGPVWVTLGVALAVVAVTVLAGFAVQRVALSEPSAATFDALRTATWLSRYRLTASAFSVNGGPTVHGECLQDWFAPGGDRRRGAVLRLDDGLVVLDVPPHTLVVSGGTAAERALDPLVLVELGGCTRVLQRRVETLAQQRQGLSTSGDRLLFALKGTRVALTLDAQKAPVAIAVTSRRAHGAGRLRFERLTPAARRRLSHGLPVSAP
jgi:hypothetical protein